MYIHDPHRLKTLDLNIDFTILLFIQRGVHEGIGWWVHDGSFVFFDRLLCFIHILVDLAVESPPSLYLVY